MNILLLNWRDPKNPKAGGAEIVTLEHAKYWVSRGHTVTWLTSCFPNCRSADSLGGVDIIRKGSIYTVYWYAFLHYMQSRNKYDVVIDEIHGIPFFTPLYVQKPILVFIHEIAGDIWHHMGVFPINLIGRFLEPFFLRLYRSFPLWTDAQSTIKELALHGFNPKKCIAIPCPPVNPPLTKSPKKENVPTFIFVSRMVAMKGVEDILSAFAHIKSVLPVARLWLVGNGDAKYMENLRRKAYVLGIHKDITFYGYVTERRKLSLLSRAHILLHASIKEGWGLVVVEAASQWTPAVVYNVPGLRDCVLPNKTGIVVNQNKPHVLAREAVQLFLQKKKYERFQAYCYKWIVSLGWDDVKKRSLNLLESL